MGWSAWSCSATWPCCVPWWWRDGLRGAGAGARLLAHAESQARARGVKTLYLLTTTAESFFARHGYASADRDGAPPAIRATREFSGICPASSAFMRKLLQA